MGSTETIEFRVNDSEVIASQEKMITGYQLVNAQLRTQVAQALAVGNTSEKHKKVGDAADKNSQAMRRFDDLTKKAFGAGAIGQLVNYAASMVGVGAAISFVSRAFGEVARAREAGAANIRGAAGGLGKLAQLGKTPERYRELIDKSQTLFTMGAGQNLNEAAELMFDIASANQEADFEFFGKLKARGVVGDINALVTAIAGMQSSLGKAETGGAAAIVSKGLAAAEFAPGEAEHIIQAAAPAALSGAVLGLTDEEILAAVAIVAKPYGEASGGGTGVKGLLKGLELAGEFKGLTLEEIIRDIGSRGLEGKDLEKLIGGRMEGKNAFRTLLQNLEGGPESYLGTLASIRAAEGQDLVHKQMNLPLQAGETAGTIGETQGKAKALTSNRLAGLQEIMANSFMSELETGHRERGVPELGIFFEKMSEHTNRYVFGVENQLQRGVKHFQKEGQLAFGMGDAETMQKNLRLMAYAHGRELERQGRLDEVLERIGQLDEEDAMHMRMRLGRSYEVGKGWGFRSRGIGAFGETTEDIYNEISGLGESKKKEFGQLPGEKLSTLVAPRGVDPAVDLLASMDNTLKEMNARQQGGRPPQKALGKPGKDK